MSSGLLWMNIGNPLIRGLPADSEPRQAYEQLSTGFAPGAVSGARRPGVASAINRSG